MLENITSHFSKHNDSIIQDITQPYSASVDKIDDHHPDQHFSPNLPV